MKKYFYFTITLLFFVLLFLSCKSVPPYYTSNGNTPAPEIVVSNYVEIIKKKYPELSNYIDKAFELDRASRVGLLSMVGIKDKVLKDSTAKTLRENKIQGVILFSHNVVDEEQLKKLTKDLRDKVNKNIFIAVDQEGGLVSRIPFDPTRKIRPIDIGLKGDSNYAYSVAYKRARFLLSMGIDIVLGPVCDISSSPFDYIYPRTFGTNKEVVNKMVIATVKAQRDAGIISVLKHFPGHGETEVDSHLDFPVINKKLDVLKEIDFYPFQSGIDAGAEFVLISHIKNKNIDDTLPSSLSIKYRDILVDDLKFNGIIITDDLVMTGKIDKGIGWGVNLLSDVYEKNEPILKTVEPDILTCAKVLKLIDDRNEIKKQVKK